MPKIAMSTRPKPSINGPRVYGSTPGKPFLFLIPATGEAPLSYAAQNLPEELKLDSRTGIISGSLTKAGDSVVILTVSNVRGKATHELKIVVGTHKLALTPPMGWNSWNVWATAVSADKVKAAADAMVTSGLAAHGYQYICIDDTWEARERGPDGQIMGNEKFGDMKALADYVHSKGLKIGIYSSPGPRTCAGYPGSYQHELQDAQTWADWGMDYVKYDWCDYQRIFAATGRTDEDRKAPYATMIKALDSIGRDMPLCIGYSGGKPYNWGESAGGSLWRTSGDIFDTWSSLSQISLQQAGLAKFAGPSHWNDPDMLIVGKVGWGPNIHPTRLNPNEQILHITLWSLLAAPLLIGCDMSDMDSFTKRLLMNDEVLDVDQDPLGKQGDRIDVQGGGQVWARPLSDGTIAVGLLNFGNQKVKVTADFAKLGVAGKQPVRDLWRQKNLGRFSGLFSAEIPVHGAVMVKIGTPKPEK